jgi:hypothetical protein
MVDGEGSQIAEDRFSTRVNLNERRSSMFLLFQI